MNKNLIIHPKFDSLRKELEELRRKSSQLYLKAEYMQFEERPLLYSLYETTIGQLEYESFVLNVRIRLLELEISLRQSYINRNETVNEYAVSEKIEFAQQKYKIEIDQKEAEIKAAQDYLKSPAMSVEESNEIRELYRMIAKTLHPDLNPNVSQKEKDLFLKAIAAYRIGDIHVLRQVALAISEEKIEDIPEDNLPTLIESARKSIREFEKRIEAMEREFPFIYRNQLKDENWIKEQKVEISEHISAAKAKIEKLTNYLTILKLWKKESLS